ncbi:CoA transferase, partial [Phenylobacterium sp.]|uniref:CoA transferase n=1 Tax=Phenylobacterium sp. TaxID=1871053 RepID=UPI002F422724
LNISHALARPDGSGFERPRLDKMQTGMSALQCLYETADGWIAVVAPKEAHWTALKTVLNAPALEAADFATPEARRKNDAALRELLRTAFKARPALAWREALDAAGVPAEVSDPTFAHRLHDDPEMRAGGLTVTYRQELVGEFSQMGLMFNFSDTPGKVQGPPLVVGEYTREVLTELGYTADQIAELSAAKVAGVWESGQPLINGPRRFMGYKPEVYDAKPKDAPASGPAAAQMAPAK